MRVLALSALLPLALAVPTSPLLVEDNQPIAELSTRQWGWIQSTFTDHLGKLPSWTWLKAQDIVADVHTQADSDKTIWQQLKDDPNSFSKLVKIIEFQGDAIKYLDGKADPITFFAPNNDALTPPGHGRGHSHHGDHDHDHHGHDGDDDDDDDLAKVFADSSLASISSLLESDPTLTASDNGDDEDDEKKHRREMIRKFVGKILMYHAVPHELDAVHVAENSTLETVLTAEDGSFGGLARRIKVKKSLLPPSIKLNFYARVLATDRKASNGIFHTLSAPLIPPPSIFESLYLFPDVYSTFTSATQRLGEEGWIEWEYKHHHDDDDDDDDLNTQLADFAHQLLQELHLEHAQKSNDKFYGTPLATLFAPTNSAFGLLPPRLKFYLFSPFGEKALRKILGYHYIYDALILTELQHMGDRYPLPDEDDIPDTRRDIGAFNAQIEDTDKHFKKVFDVTTAINETLHIEIEKKKVLPIKGAVDVSLKVNGVPVLETDVPSRNGAFHPIGLILVPPHHEHHGDHHHHGHDGDEEGIKRVDTVDSWENWEDWLPAWAEQA